MDCQVKMVSEDEESFTVGGYGVVFGGRDLYGSSRQLHNRGTRMTPFDSEMAKSDFEAWKAYDDQRRQYERLMERAAEQMFDEIEKRVLNRLEKVAGGE